ncbi:MAG: GGDEF domain-containing protein [Pseudomonadota bacterium]
MQRVKTAVLSPAAPAASPGKSPTDIARETLRMLALRRLAPTPANYQRFYEEIAGTRAHSEDGLQPPLGALHELARGDATLKELVAQMERVLGAYGRSPLLKDKLLALIQSWEGIRGQGSGIEVAASPVEAAAPAPASGGGAQALEIPLAAGALARLEIPATPLSSAETLRRLLAEVLRHDVAPRFVVDPSMNAELVELADLAAQADSAETCNQLSDRLNAFWKAAADVRGLDVRLVPDLMGLVRLLVENIGELVDDDQWIGGQVDVMRKLMTQPLTPELLGDAQMRFREIIQHQGTLKHSLADAKSTLKDMISIFVERLGEMSDSTAVYHDKIGVYAERIERTEDVSSLRDVLDELMGDIRTMQSAALRSRDEVAAARKQAEAAESKIRQLETELEEISEKVREDALTGSLNRRGIDEALAAEAARAERYGNALCVSVIDLDNFKNLNDTHGHSAGDEALVHLVKVVKALLRPSDSIGRFGGEEFVVLLPETTLDAGKFAIERLQRELTKQFFLANNEKLLITFSAGVAQLRPGESESEVVKRADRAMYRAKQAGKNRVFIDA